MCTLVRTSLCPNVTKFSKSQPCSHLMLTRHNVLSCSLESAHSKNNCDLLDSVSVTIEVSTVLNQPFQICASLFIEVFHIQNLKKNALKKMPLCSSQVKIYVHLCLSRLDCSEAFEGTFRNFHGGYLPLTSHWEAQKLG